MNCSGILTGSSYFNVLSSFPSAVKAAETASPSAIDQALENITVLNDPKNQIELEAICFLSLEKNSLPGAVIPREALKNGIGYFFKAWEIDTDRIYYYPKEIRKEERARCLQQAKAWLEKAFKEKPSALGALYLAKTCQALNEPDEAQKFAKDPLLKGSFEAAFIRREIAGIKNLPYYEALSLVCKSGEEKSAGKEDASIKSLEAAEGKIKDEKSVYSQALLGEICWARGDASRSISTYARLANDPESKEDNYPLWRLFNSYYFIMDQSSFSSVFLKVKSNASRFPSEINKLIEKDCAKILRRRMDILNGLLNPK